MLLQESCNLFSFTILTTQYFYDNCITMKEKTCLDCLNCKLVDTHRRLSCFKGMWVKNDWDKKYIILRSTERESLDINYRDIFSLAGRCQEYKSMDEGV